MNKPAITALITVDTHNEFHFRDFGGKHLCRLMIDKLLSIGNIERVAITTESPQVKEWYRVNNKVSFIDPPHPDRFSDDSTARILEEMHTSDLYTAHALEKVTGEHFMQTQCINPLLSVQTIEAAIDRYYTYVLNDDYKQFDSVMSLARVEKRLFEMKDYPEVSLRDDPHFVIFEDTVFNLFNRTQFMRNNKRKLGNRNPMFFDVPEIEHLTVETPASYQLAKLAYDNKHLFF